ncbi:MULTISPECIES: helix-turn-helix domain-containing protein [Clavibacter]|jgi:excisionase family DNA binding protein|uniref:Helix-turn-helix domain protein n=4 Tax=Clavibacter TaxID=1573 RepID=A0A251Y881_9MICO|nr:MULTISPECIES: helix-turn-helix domain-containing protein [Clavibacter]AJW78145.1 transcriptional regulator [Clavibacter michiganensis subsp. insidiosus]AWF99458.1 DNA-binding protein excisionase [Clavibacter michiganensis subsp. insidiosus]AWG00423.1 DNA-binding protein excisionase [Clavibacter michiganensis subsp. insidiosus]KXU21669.1 transcriptional regulator [Clavibacter nebraskensis]OAH22532.1 transcriptional regulator [Clavibacter nebraskensis]
MSRDLSDVRFLTVAEVAEMMRVSKMTVYRLVHSGDLPAIRFGRSFRVPESAVLAAIDPTNALPGQPGEASRHSGMSDVG